MKITDENKRIRLYTRIGRFLYKRGWKGEEAKDLRSSIFILMISSDKPTSLELCYFRALRKCFPVREMEFSRDVETITYVPDFITKADSSLLLEKIPKKDRICVLNFMYDRDKSSSKGLEMRRRRIFQTLRDILEERENEKGVK